MTNPQQLLESWKDLKKTILKKRINAQEEIKFILHELVLTLSSEMSEYSNYGSIFDGYRKESPEEVKQIFKLINARNSQLGVINNSSLLLKEYYYQPLTLWIKAKAKELKVSWE